MTLDVSAHVPYYIQIKSHLLQEISTMQPDTAIPSEAALAARFGVSRGTVKQAIMDLVYEGILYRVQGKGTFVSPVRIPRSFNRLPSFTTDIRKMGYQSHNQVLQFGPVQATAETCAFLQLEAGEPVYRFKRLVELDGRPLAVVSSFLSPRVYPGLALEDMGESLYNSLQAKYGKVPTKARDTYSIVEAAPKTAALLALPENAAIFFSTRHAYLDDMAPAEYVESFIRSDRFKFDISIGFGDESAGAGSAAGEGGNAGATHYGIGFRNVITENSAAGR